MPMSWLAFVVNITRPKFVRGEASANVANANAKRTLSTDVTVNVTTPTAL
jgi:hypothetical protein